MLRRSTMAMMAVLLLALPLAACGDDGTVQMAPFESESFCIDGWDEKADVGDQALVERKVRVNDDGTTTKTNVFVIPLDASFTFACKGDYKVKLSLDADGHFAITDMGGVLLGEDHDNCYGPGEVRAELKVPENQRKFEPEIKNPDKSNDDCERNPES